MALTHLILQLLKKSNYIVPWRRLNTGWCQNRPGCTIPPASSSLRRLYLYFNTCSHLIGLGWRMHSLLVKIDTVLPHHRRSCSAHPEFASPLRKLSRTVASWRRQGYSSVLLWQIESVFKIMSSCQHSPSGKTVRFLHIQVDSQDCKMILAQLQNLHSGQLRCLVTITTTEKNSCSNTCQCKLPSCQATLLLLGKFLEPELYDTFGRKQQGLVSLSRVRNKGKFALFPKTSAQMGAEHLRPHQAFLNGLASHATC